MLRGVPQAVPVWEPLPLPVSAAEQEWEQPAAASAVLIDAAEPVSPVAVVPKSVDAAVAVAAA